MKSVCLSALESMNFDNSTSLVAVYDAPGAFLILEDEKKRRKFVMSDTGDRPAYFSSLNILERFVRTLPVKSMMLEFSKGSTHA